jgi:hypothetical protein
MVAVGGILFAAAGAFDGAPFRGINKSTAPTRVYVRRAFMLRFCSEEGEKKWLDTMCITTTT